MADKKAYIRIVHTITLTNQVEYNESNYPGMTIEQAAYYERGVPLLDKLQTIIEQLEIIDPEKVGFAEEVTVKYE